MKCKYLKVPQIVLKYLSELTVDVPPGGDGVLAALHAR